MEKITIICDRCYSPSYVRSYNLKAQFIEDAQKDINSINKIDLCINCATEVFPSKFEINTYGRYTINPDEVKELRVMF